MLCKYNFSFNYSVDLLHGELQLNSSMCDFTFDTDVVVVVRNSHSNRFGAATIETCSGDCASCVFNMQNVSIPFALSVLIIQYYWWRSVIR